jgi:hypothetical protein
MTIEEAFGVWGLTADEAVRALYEALRAADEDTPGPSLI